MDLTNGLGVGNRLACVGLTEAFFNFCQETKPFDSIFKRGCVREQLDSLKNSLLDGLSSHDNHLM